MPAREVAGLGDAGRLARVDDDHALGVLDRERVNRKRLGPRAVEERVQQPSPAVADPFDLACFDGDGPGLDRVDLHRMPSSPVSGRRQYLSKTTTGRPTATSVVACLGPPGCPERRGPGGRFEM